MCIEYIQYMYWSLWWGWPESVLYSSLLFSTLSRSLSGFDGWDDGGGGWGGIYRTAAIPQYPFTVHYSISLLLQLLCAQKIIVAIQVQECHLNKVLHRELFHSSVACLAYQTVWLIRLPVWLTILPAWLIRLPVWLLRLPVCHCKLPVCLAKLQVGYIRLPVPNCFYSSATICLCLLMLFLSLSLCSFLSPPWPAAGEDLISSDLS